ncbi:ANTAR domain-containing response regulator [Streptomyces sp. NPDC008222]|uniref:ANTAR domain-containing response regulator n=1 Tax=Streptomyces sp. NPDC008222 TaxID=3364820 RepID=UPI0036E33BC9
MVLESLLEDTGVMSVKIVIVDDDPGFRRMAAILLTARGLNVVAESEDGASGLAAVRRLAPDGVLLDLNLPDQDGVSVARTLLLGSHQPTVVLTSTDQPTWSSEELSDAGVLDFIAKDRLFDTDLLTLFSS